MMGVGQTIASGRGGKPLPYRWYPTAVPSPRCPARRRLAGGHRKFLLLGPAQHDERGGLAAALLGEEPVQLVDGAHRLAGETDDDVAGEDSGGARRPVGRGRLDPDAALARQLVEAHDAARQADALPAYARMSAPHPAVAEQARRPERAPG